MSLSKERDTTPWFTLSKWLLASGSSGESDIPTGCLLPLDQLIFRHRLRRFLTMNNYVDPYPPDSVPLFNSICLGLLGFLDLQGLFQAWSILQQFEDAGGVCLQSGQWAQGSWKASVVSFDKFSHVQLRELHSWWSLFLMKRPPSLLAPPAEEVNTKQTVAFARKLKPISDCYDQIKVFFTFHNRWFWTVKAFEFPYQEIKTHSRRNHALEQSSFSLSSSSYKVIKILSNTFSLGHPEMQPHLKDG